MPDDNLFRTEAELAAEEARKNKAERLKDAGNPIAIPGKPVQMQVRDNDVWTAETGGVLRRTLLETGETRQIYKGHTGPVTCFAFYDQYVLTGSWDKTIRVWDTETKKLLSTTPAHSDFVKALLIIPSERLLASSSSDKIVRFWDLSEPNWHNAQLKALGSISAHTRPVECLAVDENSFACTRLFTADTMGVIKVWRLERRYGPSANCKGILETELSGHRTGINDMWHGLGQLWTASTDATLQLHAYPLPRRPLKKEPVVEHPVSVRCLLALQGTELGLACVLTGSGDVIRAYDVSSVEEPELLGSIDGHAHDVTNLALWLRVVTPPGAARPKFEPWIVSGSLDGTLRKWRLTQLLKPVRGAQAQAPPPLPVAPPKPVITLTEEEERQLADLMDSEDSSSSDGGGTPEPDAGPSHAPRASATPSPELPNPIAPTVVAPTPAGITV